MRQWAGTTCWYEVQYLAVEQEELAPKLSTQVDITTRDSGIACFALRSALLPDWQSVLSARHRSRARRSEVTTKQARVHADPADPDIQEPLLGSQDRGAPSDDQTEQPTSSDLPQGTTLEDLLKALRDSFTVCTSKVCQYLVWLLSGISRQPLTSEEQAGLQVLRARLGEPFNHDLPEHEV